MLCQKLCVLALLMQVRSLMPANPSCKVMRHLVLCSCCRLWLRCAYSTVGLVSSFMPAAQTQNVGGVSGLFSHSTSNCVNARARLRPT